MSNQLLNVLTLVSACLVLYWCARWIYNYIHEMKEMVADIWWNSEKLAMEYRTAEAEALVTSDRPVDWYMDNARDEIDRLTGDKIA